MGILAICTRPVRISQMPSKSIPMFLVSVSLMVPTSFGGYSRYAGCFFGRPPFRFAGAGSGSGSAADGCSSAWPFSTTLKRSRLSDVRRNSSVRPCRVAAALKRFRTVSRFSPGSSTASPYSPALKSRKIASYCSSTTFAALCPCFAAPAPLRVRVCAPVALPCLLSDIIIALRLSYRCCHSCASF